MISLITSLYIYIYLQNLGEEYEGDPQGRSHALGTGRQVSADTQGYPTQRGEEATGKLGVQDHRKQNQKVRRLPQYCKITFHKTSLYYYA